MKLTFKFVKLGEQAPDKIPGNELWIDVGNRAGPGVLDHHSDSVSGWSASELIVNKYKEFALAHLKDIQNPVLVLHEQPDLDCICGAWLIKKIILDKVVPENDLYIKKIVDDVSKNDQGFIRTSEPLRCWPVVMRTFINLERHAGLDHKAVVLAAMELIEQTLKYLSEGLSLEDSAKLISTNDIEIVISQAYSNYLKDIARAKIFQLKLPVRNEGFKNLNEPSPENWSVADALYIEEPSSQLFKELARGDKTHSPGKQGFSFLIISHEISLPQMQTNYRYIISTDPLSGFFMPGLGLLLEKAEQDNEDSNNIPLFEGRQRVEGGTGRHGYNVKSPWYDGRGHFYTIIDSPSVTLNGKNMCVSQLKPEEILNIVWDYGDPAKSVSILDGQLSVLLPVSLKEAPENFGFQSIDFESLVPEFGNEVLDSFTISNKTNQLRMYKAMNKNKYEQDGYGIEEQYLLYFSKSCSVLYLKMLLNKRIKNIRELSDKLNAFREFDFKRWLPAGIIVRKDVEHSFISHLRVKPAEINLEDTSGVSAKVMYRTAAMLGNNYYSQPDDDEVIQARKVFSRDRRNVFFAARNNFGVYSTRSIPLKEENDFHNPLKLALLVSLNLLEKITLKALFSFFISHRHNFSSKTSKNIIKDRWQLMNIEQLLSFNIVTEKRFGQNIYELTRDLFGVDKLFGNMKQKIEALAEQVRDLRSDFLQKVGTWISVLFAPLALTVAFFSGTHMQKNFSDAYLDFVPGHSHYSGWLFFLIVFIILSLFSGGIWFFIRSDYRKSEKSIIDLFDQ